MSPFVFYYCIGLCTVILDVVERYEQLCLLLSDEFDDEFAIHLVLTLVILLGALIWPLRFLVRR